ncbi:SagB family peptide dehydrogenase [Thermodesulfobacteriota bacterium B35]
MTGARALHRQTVHTRASVRAGGWPDWSGQPQVFKHYPSGFPRLALARLPDLRRLLFLCAGLTARRVYGDSTWFLRANPSAGALYPCELYVQARGVAGLADGIYHFEPDGERLCLLHRLEGDGLESCCRDNRMVEGLLLLVSAIYYRSSWKYRDRALRYCLLDSGHLLGGIEAAAVCRRAACRIICRIDRQRLAACFGFAGQEHAMAMVVMGRRCPERVSSLAMQLPFVSGSGPFVVNPFIEKAMEEIGRPDQCTPAPGGVRYPFSAETLEDAMARRRSIRAFSGVPLKQREFRALLALAAMPPALDCNEPVRVLAVVNRVEGLAAGIYVDDRCLAEGDFTGMARHLCLEQDLGGDSGATLFLAGASDNYLPLLLKAGLLGHRLYLGATGLGFGCSGIGAFYDQEVASFFDTGDMILYALAVGR